MHGTEARSLLHPFLLLLIYERPGHGYDLINRLTCLGVPDVEPGHVYKMLRGLEAEKLLVSAWVTSNPGPARRRYELTARGRADLEAWMARLTEFDHMLGACLTRWAEASTSPARQVVDMVGQSTGAPESALDGQPSGPRGSLLNGQHH